MSPFPVSIPSCGLLVANSALALATSRDIQIGAFIRMACRAVCLNSIVGAMNRAVRLAIARLPISHVFDVITRYYVIGIAAPSIVACMPPHSCTERFVRMYQIVRNPMCWNVFSADAEVSVFAAEAAHPPPTRIRATRHINPRPETFSNRPPLVERIAVAVKAQVVTAAPAAGKDRLSAFRHATYLSAHHG